MQIAKVVQSGNTQAIRMPKEYKIDAQELCVQQVGSSIILTPKNSIWDSFENSINQFSNDLFSEGREQPLIQEREDL